jgi:hypothetical protein
MLKKVFLASLLLTGCVSSGTNKMAEPVYTQFMLRCITSGLPTHLVYASVCDCLSDILQKKGELTEEDATSCTAKENSAGKRKEALPPPIRREIQM